MKILYISNSRIPTEKAHGVQIMEMCEAFGNQKVNLKLVLPARKNKEYKNTDPFEYYGVKQNFKIKKLFCFDPHILVKFPQGIYIKFQATFFIISLFFFLLFKKRKNGYIFYTRDEYLLPALQHFSKKVVWEAHNLPSKKKYYLKFWKKCHKIVTISSSIKQDLVNWGIEENKILVASDGVDMDKFNVFGTQKEIRKRLILPLHKKIILYTGHFYKWKGVQTLADSAKEIKNYLIVFVGGKDHKFKKFKNKNNLENILYTDYKEYSQIPYYLKAADILVLPNSAQDKKSKYTSPLKLFEYMASGTPIIASELENFKEILNESNAVFFKPDDVQDLVEKINHVLNNTNLAQQIVSQALQNVQNYTWEKRAEKIINFIK